MYALLRSVVCSSLLTVTVYGEDCLPARRAPSSGAPRRAQGQGSSEIERSYAVRPLPLSPPPVRVCIIRVENDSEA